jgi:hypothetical protein
MLFSSRLLTLFVVLQVPPPATGSEDASLKAEAQAIIQRESKSLESLAARLAGSERVREAEEIRRLLPRARPKDGATRLALLPEVVVVGAKGLASVASGTPAANEAAARTWRAEVDKIRSQAASELFALAKQAATAKSPRYALAAVCLRDVLERQPDHPEARRLLGYIRYDGGWARPFAVSQLKEDRIKHSVFGWVPETWVPHLNAGELPAPGSRAQKTVQWLSAQEANELRSDWKNPWQITTEHFDIHSDVPLSEAVEFAQRLESFYDLFFTLMPDVVGDSVPLASRFRSPSLTGESNYRPHQVFYFATKDEYVEYLRPLTGGEIEDSLGFYNPPKPGKGNRATAYFFRDQDERIPVSATLYHEVSHQLLFETAGPNHYTKNAGNYWVFEGLGTYFETVTPLPGGSIEVGGLVGERLAAAQQTLAAGRFLPLASFLQLNQVGFNRADRIRDYYQEAMALAVFLMHWNDGAYRDAFLDYVHDAYRGRIKRTTGRSLEDRLGVALDDLDKQFRSFLSKAEIKR